MQMKLVKVEYLFDGSKAVFFFTADGRVDFRDLVKDLAHTFHTRIEMRQIGVRDESKLIGGIGICGGGYIFIRLGYRGQHPPACGLLQRRGTQAHLWACLEVRSGRLRQFP